MVLIMLAATPIILSRFGTTQKMFSDIEFNSSSSTGMGRFGELFYALKSALKGLTKADLTSTTISCTIIEPNGSRRLYF